MKGKKAQVKICLKENQACGETTRRSESHAPTYKHYSYHTHALSHVYCYHQESTCCYTVDIENILTHLYVMAKMAACS